MHFYYAVLSLREFLMKFLSNYYLSMQHYAAEYFHYYLLNSHPRRDQWEILPLHHDLSTEWKEFRLFVKFSMQFFWNYHSRQLHVEESTHRHFWNLHPHRVQGEFLPFQHDLRREVKEFRLLERISDAILFELPFKAALRRGVFPLLSLELTSAPRSIRLITVSSWPAQRKESV